MKLFDYNKEIQYLLDQIDPETGVIDDTLFEDIEQLQIGESDKLEGLALYAKELEGHAFVINEKADVMYNRAKAMGNKAKQIRQYLASYLEATNRSKFKTDYINMYLTKKPKCEITDEKSIIEFAEKHIEMGLVKTSVEVSKTAVSNAIKSGIDIPGATIIETQSLTVR